MIGRPLIKEIISNPPGWYNKGGEIEGLEKRGNLECAFCEAGCAPYFPLPYVLFTKLARNRKRRYVQLEKEILFNLRILGLNQLWGGKWVEVHSRRAVHWDCATEELRLIFRHILKWDTKVLNLLACRATFEDLTKEVKLTYSAQVESKIVHFQEVRAMKIALPKTEYNIIPMLQLLPPKWRDFYATARTVVKQGTNDWDKAKSIKVRLHMDRKEYMQVLKIMKGLGMVEWRAIEEVQIVNGLQCVRKDVNKLRLIFDGRPANCVVVELEKVELLGFHLLDNWSLLEGQEGVFGKIDLDNYYHPIGVPEWLKAFLGLPALTKKEYESLTGKIGPGEKVGVVCTTLPP